MTRRVFRAWKETHAPGPAIPRDDSRDHDRRAGPTVGVPVSYQLPTDGPLPRTYRVTLAIVDAKNPDWIISQFACGVARTVTAENGGKFTETWDGLDDNFMPVPPGDYAVKGIYMPARQWPVDGEWHTVTPKFVGGASSLAAVAGATGQTPQPFGGDPVGSPLGDVAVGPNGVAVFYYRYLENGHEQPDARPEQAGRLRRSSSAPSTPAARAAVTATATDGETVWAIQHRRRAEVSSIAPTRSRSAAATARTGPTRTCPTAG